MKHEPTELQKNTIYLLIAVIANYGITFISTALFSRWLNVATFGKYDVLNSYVLLLLPGVSLCVQEAIFRYCVDANDITQHAKYITNAFVICIVNYIIVGALIVVYASLTNNLLEGILLQLMLFSQLTVLLMRGVLRGLRRMELYSVSILLSSLLTLLFVFVFVFCLGMELVGMILGYAMGVFSGCLIMMTRINLMRYIDVSAINKGSISGLLQYSIMLVPNDISWWIMHASDRKIVNFFMGYSANGVLAAAHKIPTLCMGIFGVFSVSLQQELVVTIKKDEAVVDINRIVNNILVFVISIGIILLSCNGYLMSLLFDARYQDAALYSPVLITATILTSASQCVGGIHIALKHTKANGYSTICGAIINIISHLLLIRSLGMFAAVLSTLIANMVVFALRLILVKKDFVFIPEKRMLLCVLAYCYFFLVSYLGNSLIGIVNVIIGILFCYYLNRRVLMSTTSMLKDRVKELIG